MWLTVAEGERHDGTAGSGVVLDRNGGTNATIFADDDFTRVEWLEITDFGTGIGVSCYAKDLTIANNIIHDGEDGIYSHEGNGGGQNTF